MDYQNKYLKYKNKYQYLKNYKYINDLTNNDLLIGGADIPCEIELKDQTQNIYFKINFIYSDQAPNHKLIKNFLITKYDKSTNNIIETIKTTFDIFYVNNEFFENELNIDLNIAKKNTLIKKEITNYDFTKCEKLNIQNNYLKINNDNDVKTFISSYFKKNMCILNQSTKIFTNSLINHHNLLELYLTLCIIHQYNKIELIKYNNPPNRKYIEIYKNIPKYIESDIDNSKIEFLCDNNQYINISQNINGIDGSQLKIIFDSGNSSTTLISKKFLKYLCYYDLADKINISFKNKLYFENFYKPSGIGVYGNLSEEVTFAYLLKFRFNDQKLNNEKIYNIIAFESNSNAFDLLFGQNTLSQLYEDGFSIKWRSTISIGKLYIDNILEDYNKIINNDPSFVINKTKTQNDFDKLTPNEHDKIIKIIKNFFSGKFIERLTISDILKIKNKLKVIYNILKQQEYQLSITPPSSPSYLFLKGYIDFYNSYIGMKLLDKIFS